jgi:hypothetical protein
MDRATRRFRTESSQAIIRFVVVRPTPTTADEFGAFARLFHRSRDRIEIGIAEEPGATMSRLRAEFRPNPRT